MAKKPATITQLNDYLAKTIKLDPILGNIYAVGQISDLKYHSSGNIYFSAIDDFSKIRCLIPSIYAKYLDFKLENGQEVLMNGYVDLYKKGGSYSLIIKTIETSGVGKASLEFERLKNQLQNEGLFDKQAKKPIPFFPKSIGIISSETGAALQDILSIIKSKNNYVDIYIFPVLVQGEKASNDMATTINYINNNYPFIDTLIIGRGGGSQEDLIPFNDEELARAIYQSKIPIISGVGHEIDYTICDFVSDQRAETPTAAAHLAVPDINKLKNDIEVQKNILSDSITRVVEYDALQAENYIHRIQSNFENYITNLESALSKYKSQLDSNNPFNVLENGYAVVLDERGKAITSVKEINPSKTYDLVLNDGKIKICVEEKRHEE